VQPIVEAGGSLAPIWSKGTCTSADGVVFLADHPASGLAVGFYVGAGATVRLGPGSLLALFRYASLRTDMDYPWMNPEGGELQGSNLVLGYRLELLP
jgi:hypothetical protein